jgi:hypothetical protein
MCPVFIEAFDYKPTAELLYAMLFTPCQALFVYNDWLERNKDHPGATVTLYEVRIE